MDRIDLQNLARERSADAQALLSAGRFSGAYYLAGYAVECALKACVARLVTAESFPDWDLAKAVYTHDLRKLATAANLDGAIRQREETDEHFEANWTKVREWSEQARYEFWPEVEARRMLEAVSDPAHGVLPC